MCSDECVKTKDETSLKSAFVSAYRHAYEGGQMLYGNMHSPNTPMDDAADEGLLAGRVDRSSESTADPEGAWLRSHVRHAAAA